MHRRPFGSCCETNSRTGRAAWPGSRPSPPTAPNNHLAAVSEGQRDGDSDDGKQDDRSEPDQERASNQGGLVSTPSRHFSYEICALPPIDDDVSERTDGVDGVKKTKLRRLQRASNDGTQKDAERSGCDLSDSKVRNISGHDPGGI